ncbi:unnamed protein product [Orchesella dallaii]|uniref:Serine incorporator n=1 Tax=Orchesella dallaii TaxID=48710 RepID=A0ABP1PNB0_9HEXA
MSASNSQEITPLVSTPPPPEDNSEVPPEGDSDPTATGSGEGSPTLDPGGGDPEALKPKKRTSRQQKPPNFCQKLGGVIMKIFAHDAIYGSFVGPHPVSFLSLCALCRGSCDRKCMIPFSVSSIATKTMYFLMLAVVTILSAFFIVPWPESLLTTQSTIISKFYPCQDKKIRNMDKNGGCHAHAGHFMVYRCFLAFATAMLTNSFVLSFVDSTSENPHRSKIHQGFWLYKYVYLGGLMAMYFLFLNGSTDPEGVFELVCSILGNVAHFLFSLIELTFILDIVEFWIITNKRSGAWAEFFYWCSTGVVSLCSLTMFIYICSEFSRERSFTGTGVGYDNCVPGTMGDVDPSHAGMITASFFTILLLAFSMCFKRKFQQTFPNVGWLQVAVISLFNFSYLWSALYSSPNVHSRPRCNWALPRPGSADWKIQGGSTDVYFRSTGFYHGVMAILALLYFAFIHGPRSTTAPLSIVYDTIFKPKARIPLFPDMHNAPEEFVTAVRNHKVWDDEDEDVGYSWSRFYFMMVIGSLSLMMAMTNFTNPWASDMYNSSLVAYGFKFTTGTFSTLVYMSIVVAQCNCSKERRRKQKPSPPEPEPVEEVVVIEVVEDEEEEVEEPRKVSIKSASVENIEMPVEEEKISNPCFCA